MSVDLAKIAFLSRLGTPQKEIARELGISVHVVRMRRRALGLPPLHSYEPLSARMIQNIINAKRVGHGAPRIARELGLPQHRVSAVLREAGFGSRGHRQARAKFSEHELRAMRRELRSLESKWASKLNVSIVAEQRVLRRRK